LRRQGGAEVPDDAPAALVRLEPKSGAGEHHRRASRANGRDDFFGIHPFEVDRGGAEARMAELSPDDVQRHAPAGELERVRTAQPMRREAAPDARLGRDSPELGADGGA
jgi:hypothetical protein